MHPLVALVLVGLQADPYNLPIGRPGTLMVKPNEIVSTHTGKVATMDEVLDACSRSKFVYIGESHDKLKHHEMQAAVIAGLAQRGYDVIVGLEMFTRPNQGNLNPWTLGWWDEATFIREADWKGQWGFEYAIYKPIFDATRKHKLRMAALNVPRDWVRTVGRGGWDALSPEQKAAIPAWTPPHPKHRNLFNAMIGGHPMSGNAAENMYMAQCLWDIAMADSAVKYLRANYVSRKTIFVVLAGSGHVMYDSAIPYRVAEYLADPPKTTIVCIETQELLKVARGIGDFVYATSGK
jgi:uncharacterized iron-regulated protein